MGVVLHGAGDLVTRALRGNDLYKAIFLQSSLVKLILRLPMS